MLDDDGKLKQRWHNKRVNAKKEGIPFELSYSDFCELVERAGLKSSNLGFTGDGYVLARRWDCGPYSFENCRFITQKRNALEKRVSRKSKNASSVNSRVGLAALRSIDTAELARRRRIGRESSEKVKALKESYRKQEAERRSSLNPSYTEERNSQYGSFWITDGSVNKKWSVSKGDIPEGFRRGRAIGRGY